MSRLTGTSKKVKRYTFIVKLNVRKTKGEEKMDVYGERERERKQVFSFFIMVKGRRRLLWCGWEIAGMHGVNNLAERIMRINVFHRVVCLSPRLGFKDSESPRWNARLSPTASTRVFSEPVEPDAYTHKHSRREVQHSYYSVNSEAANPWADLKMSFSRLHNLALHISRDYPQSTASQVEVEALSSTCRNSERILEVGWIEQGHKVPEFFLNNLWKMSEVWNKM